MNHIISKYQAVVEGKQGAMAGCTNVECPSRSYCLRADARLAYRANHKIPTGESVCRYFILVEDNQ